MKKYQGQIYVLISAILYGGFGVWAVLLGPDFANFFQGYVRSGIVLIFLIPATLFYKEWKKIEKKDYKIFSFVCVSALFFQVPMYMAYQNLGVGLATLIISATTLITQYVLGKFLLSENINYIKVFSLLLSCFGLILIYFYQINLKSLFPILMATVAGLGIGTQISFTKLIPKKYPILQISTIMWVTGFLLNLCFSFLLQERQMAPEFNIHWVAIFFFAISSLLANYFLVAGYKKVEASVGGLIGLTEIVFAILFGYFIFNEQITLSVFFGSLIIIFAAALPNLNIKKYFK
jgi:drug/metabolite transporter (DMT)-like permease